MSVTVSFKGRRVLVTGGAKGMGLAIVRKFVESEATVFVLDQNEVELEEIEKAYPMVTTVTADLSHWNKSRKIIQALGPIHHLVNNAGLCGHPEFFMDITSKSIDEFSNVYFKPIVNVSQVVAKGMIDNKLDNATIVNISSVSDTVAVGGLGMYSCTKAGVTMLTKVMALELGVHNIRVNCVRPSMVNNNIINNSAINPENNVEILSPIFGKRCEIYENVLRLNERKIIKRMVDMTEVAEAVIFLSSYASKMVNGSDILLDGGLLTS